MSCVSGTNIVNDGLVFHYDLENGVKSWKGKPTTNVILTNLLDYAKDNGCTVVETGEVYEGMPVYRGTFNYGTLPRIRTNFDYTDGQTFTGSIYYRVVEQGSHTPSLYFREINFGVGYVSTPLSSTEWTRTSITHTFSGSSTCMFLLYQSSSASTSNTAIDFAMPQTELNTFPTRYINGTRLDTASIIDISGNNHVITANNMVYTQDDTPTFDGTDSFLVTGTPDLRNSSFTLQAWVNISTLNRYNPIIGDDQYNWFGLYFDASNNLISQHRKQSGQDNGLSYVTNGSISTNIWYQITSVFNILSGKSLYINGELVSSNSNTFEFTLAPNRGPQYIGRHARGVPGSQDYFAGEIDQVKIYNKALTESEIKQNFEATRSRYGI